MPRTTLLLALALTGCTGTSSTDDTGGVPEFECTMQGEGLEAQLVHTDGCADVALHAWTEDGQRLLQIRFDEGLVDEAEQQGDLSRVWSLPADDIDIALLEGPCAYEHNCDDAIECDDLDVQENPASQGSLALEIDPDGPTARVELCDVTFGGSVDDGWIGQMSWSATVGWYPG